MASTTGSGPSSPYSPPPTQTTGFPAKRLRVQFNAQDEIREYQPTLSEERDKLRAWHACCERRRQAKLAKANAAATANAPFESLLLCLEESLGSDEAAFSEDKCWSEGITPRSPCRGSSSSGGGGGGGSSVDRLRLRSTFASAGGIMPKRRSPAAQSKQPRSIGGAARMQRGRAMAAACAAQVLNTRFFEVAPDVTTGICDVFAADPEPETANEVTENVGEASRDAPALAAELLPAASDTPIHLTEDEEDAHLATKQPIEAFSSIKDGHSSEQAHEPPVFEIAYYERLFSQ